MKWQQKKPKSYPTTKRKGVCFGMRLRLVGLALVKLPEMDSRSIYDFSEAMAF